ncbi:hypothetical protein B0T16DRAFT_72739 [Cercophora newfieldiana]|uniref:Uncharacterized protein n=1 Tax=Cercophora newfieldiana TaxID=92897 RepID=A0AA40CUD6_9PEZI|nr:hypothetical protein B0T16DRAFT_72739 [Cercophora newfieldiana]
MFAHHRQAGLRPGSGRQIQASHCIDIASMTQFFQLPSHPIDNHHGPSQSSSCKHTQTHTLCSHTGSAVFSLTALLPGNLFHVSKLFPLAIHHLPIPSSPYSHPHLEPPGHPINARQVQAASPDTMPYPPCIKNNAKLSEKNKPMQRQQMQTEKMKPTPSLNAWSKSVLRKANDSSRKS